MNTSNSIIKKLSLPFLLSGVLTIVGSFGYVHVAWGYGLFLISLLFLGMALVVFSFLIFSHFFETRVLLRILSQLFKLVVWAYIFAVGALGGFFIFETIAGRIGIEWVLFGPAALAAIIAFDWGVYRLVVEKNLPAWRRFGHHVTRDASDPVAMRKIFLDEVLLHRSLLSISKFRWLRHTLIFWGFSAMFGLELLAVFVREAWPAFGGEDIWEIHAHPIRLAFDFGYDFTGFMVLVGCLMALILRVIVNGKPEQKYTDTLSSTFLFFVVGSGFILEAARLSLVPADSIYWASFFGYFLSGFFSGVDVSRDILMLLWYVHVFGSCAFIAYIPAKRLIHSCATPVGRLMNSQKELLELKRQSVFKGFAGR